VDRLRRKLLAGAAFADEQLVSAGHALEYRAQPLDLHGLNEVIGRARAERVDRALHRGVTGDHDDFGRFALFQVIDQLDAIAVRQLEVSQKHVRAHLGQLDARGAQRARFGDGEPFTFHEFRQPFELFGVVVYEQHMWH
jgi:hypothetical protein